MRWLVSLEDGISLYGDRCISEIPNIGDTVLMCDCHYHSRICVCNRGFCKQHNIDISDIFVNFVFQSGRDYRLCMRHVSFLICNY